MTISNEAPVDPAIDPDLISPEIRRLVGEPVEEPDKDQVPEVTVLTDEERKDLTTLMTVGRRVKTITVMNHTVKIQTLKSTDEMRIGLYTKPYLGSQGFARAYQVAMCAAGIIEVDGAPLYSSLRQEKDPDALFAKCVDQMEQFYPLVVSQIYDAISDLEREFNELAEKLGKIVWLDEKTEFEIRLAFQQGLLSQKSLNLFQRFAARYHLYLVRRNAVRETERNLKRHLWYTDGERYNDLFVHGLLADDETNPAAVAGEEDQDVEDLAEYDRYFDQLDETRTMTGEEMFALNNGGSWI